MSSVAGRIFVLDLDQVGGLVGDVLVLGGDDGDGRADLEDFFVEEKAVGRAAAQLHVAVFRGQVAAVQNVTTPGKRLRFGRIDALDLGVRMRAAQRAREQHAGHAHVLSVLAEVGHDAEPVQSRNALADDLELATACLRQVGGVGTWQRPAAERECPGCWHRAR